MSGSQRGDHGGRVGCRDRLLSRSGGEGIGGVAGLSVYVPMDRRHALAHGQALPGRSQGTALFADITGFTPITDALVRTYGRQRGAEETTALLDRVYGALIAEVDRHHGAVIGFSGDAITCWFDGDPGPSAITAALAMRDAASSLVGLPMVDGSPVPIAVKVTVAPGPIHRFIVGDPGIQVWDVIAGSTVERLASAAGHTVSGQVVLAATEEGPIQGVTLTGGWHAIDGGVWAVVGSAEPAAPSPWPKMDELALADDLVSRWLPPAVYRHLRTGDKYLAELRPGVSVFVRFGGIDFTSDQDDRDARRVRATRPGRPGPPRGHARGRDRRRQRQLPLDRLRRADGARR